MTAEYLNQAQSEWDQQDPFPTVGRIREVEDLIVESVGPSVSYGELCHIETPGMESVQAEVVGIEDEGSTVQLMPIGEMQGINATSRVIPTGKPFQIRCGEHLLGRVIDGRGNPIDAGPKLSSGEPLRIYREPPSSLHRHPVDQPLATGIRAIDGCLTLGRGQRIGIFSGSGVGKSTLLGMIARYTEADVSVIALVGERRREVRDFVEKNLPDEAREQSVLVVATSDQPPLIRRRAAFIATTVAEFFRDRGQDVMLMMDSLTRVAWAQRDIGLAAGQPPANRGYPPSVFNLMPQLLERSGTGETGSITGIYTVLVEGDDMNEPISDTARGILDGHISLKRDLASRNHYPAIDVLNSVSRVMEDVADEQHKDAAGKLQEVVATYRDAEDLINIGAYEEGSNPRIDHALAHIDSVNNFLQQGINETMAYEETVKRLKEIFQEPSSEDQTEDVPGT